MPGIVTFVEAFYDSSILAGPLPKVNSISIPLFVISQFNSMFAGFFSTIFWMRILRILVQETSPDALRATLETSTSAISYFLEVHILRLRSKTDLLTLEHGIATGPVNRATFQSASLRASILKLEDCTVSVGASLD